MEQLGRVWWSAKQEPERLAYKQIYGLARYVHEHYLRSFGEDPGERAEWIAHKGSNPAVLEGRIGDAPAIRLNEMPNARRCVAERFGENLTLGDMKSVSWPWRSA